MKYLVESAGKHVAHLLEEEHIHHAMKHVQARMDEGAVIGAYSKVGGGSVWVVEAEGNAELYRTLRSLQISGVTVTPVVEVMDVLGAYAEHHEKLRSAGGEKHAEHAQYRQMLRKAKA